MVAMSGILDLTDDHWEVRDMPMGTRRFRACPCAMTITSAAESAGIAPRKTACDSDDRAGDEAPEEYQADASGGIWSERPGEH